MTTFEVIVDDTIRCRGMIKDDSFTATNVNDSTKSMTGAIHHLFAFLQEALEIPNCDPSATPEPVASDAARRGLLWTRADGQRHLAQVEVKDGRLFAVKHRHGVETLEQIPAREFWAAVCNVISG